MGQRHQIFIKLPYEMEIKCDYEENTYKSNIVGLHNQWLYGRTAIEQLQHALTYLHNASTDTYGVFNYEYTINKAPQAFKWLYTLNPVTGYYHEHSLLSEDEIKNPMYCDNNDGFTIIDATDSTNLKYCMTSGEDLLTPISAQDYVSTYY